MTWDITPATLKAVCKENNLYCHKPELNDVLYLHYKGITKLENLQAFSGLKALYLEGNAISVIENMQHMTDLKCLFMSKNILHGLEGIQQLAALATLDVSHNDLYSLAPVSALASLQSLNAGHNKLSSAEAIAPLLHCAQLKTLDLEKNRIACPEALDTIMTMPLALLRLVGNPVVSATKNYRKKAMIQMPELQNLDDMPCFPKDRRLAAVFMQGGAQAEAAERVAIKEEEQMARENSRQAFNDMVTRAKEEASQRAIHQAALTEAATVTAANLTNAVLSTSLEVAAQHTAEQAKREKEVEIQQAASQIVEAAIQSVLRSVILSTQHPEVDSSASVEHMLLDARDYSSSSLSDVEPHILDHLNTQNAELEKKLAEMHVSLGGAHLGETCEEQDAPGYGCTSQGLLADMRSASRSPIRATSVRVAHGRVSKLEAKPAVWNTPRYKDLWSLALKAGDEQEQDQETQRPVHGPEDEECAANCLADCDLSNISGAGEMDVDVNEVVPVGSGLRLLQSYPIGASSDGSENKIGAHYPITEGDAGCQAMSSS